MASCFRLVVLALVFLPGCDIFLPSNQCPDLDEVCPDLVCDDYQQNREGCSICECEGVEAPGAVCWDESDCGAEQRCDVVNFCEPAPNCTEGGPCPDACYGRCIAAPSSCQSDADCLNGQICSFFSNERPDDVPDGETEPGAPEPAPVPVDSGVCQDVSCGQVDIALPECPPGSELVFKDDACGAVCLPVDFCRDLRPEECLSAPGCQIVEEGCGCSPDDPSGACDCANIERCVAVDDCSLLGVQECEGNANCVLKAIGSGGGGTEPAPPCQCAPDDPNCACDGGGGAAPPPGDPPAEQLICVPRGSDGTCLSDADCLQGDICGLSTVCGSGCAVDDDGETHCFEECWSERGLCAPSDRTCFDLGPDECLADPRCEISDNAGGAPCFCDPVDPNCGGCEEVPTTSCRPREGTCFSDFDCLQGEHCAVTEICPPCDPSSGNDIDCLAPCFIEGSCVQGAPPPVPCASDAECGIGHSCIAVTVCEACDGGSGGGSEGGAQPPPQQPCDPVCRDESVCVQTDPVCFADADCAASDFCDLSQPSCGAPGAPIAQCPGLCVARDTTTLCQADAQCGVGQRCATELANCLDNPEQPNTGCWSVCADDVTASDGSFCLSDDQCVDASGVAGTCRFQSDVCLDDPSSDTALCSGWCVGSCAEVLTPASDPNTLQCVVFNDSCIPPGWVRAEGC